VGVAAAVWAVPLVQGYDRALSGPFWWLTVTGRLKPGWSLEQATAHTRAISPGVFEASLPPNHPTAYVKDYLASRLNAVPAGARISELRENYEQSLWLLLAIAGSVLLVACANLTNLLLARASAREREIAVRQALGAKAHDVLKLVVGQGMKLVLSGVAAGLCAAFALTRVIASLLFNVSATDPATFAMVAMLVIGVAQIASYVPARRATKVDPLQSLRHE